MMINGRYVNKPAKSRVLAARAPLGLRDQHVILLGLLIVILVMGSAGYWPR
jgi:hypothetical protein